jgi:inositol phosphorylceramide synthase catalytic subunit
VKSKTKTITAPISFERFAPEMVIPYVLLGGIYLMWVTMAIGWRSDHTLYFGGITVLFFASGYTRKLVQSFGFILLYWFIFDSVRLFPNYEINPLHISEPYLAEKAWFGITTDSGILTPNEYWAQHRHILLDVYTAMIYLAWIPVPLAFGLYHFFTNKRHIVIHYLFTFLMVTQLGLLFQYLYPAAPPWYVELYGFEPHYNTPGNPGALINVDHYFGISLFSGMYDMNGNVFAAIPSLHCAFPIILLYFAATNKLRGWLVLAIILMVSTWFSAVYTNHHYTIDVILGIATGALAVSIYHFVVKRTRVYDWLEQYAKYVS